MDATLGVETVLAVSCPPPPLLHHQHNHHHHQHAETPTKRMRIFATELDLIELLQLISGCAELLPLRMAIRISAERQYPDADMSVFAYPWPEMRVLVMCLRQQHNRPYFSFHLVNDGTVDDLRECLQRIDFLFSSLDEFQICNTVSSVGQVIQDHLQQHQPHFTFGPNFPCYQFFMPRQSRDAVRAMNIELPGGFEFRELDSGNAAEMELVSSTWRHADSNDKTYTISQISHLPSVAVTHQGRLAAFEMLYPVGALKHLYTLPEFRGKGLATKIQLLMCQKLMERELCPYKFVVVSNEAALGMTEKMGGLWEHIICQRSGQPLVVDFRRVFRSDRF